ncbi:MAG: hypothetical protein ABSE66_10110, partial [Thermoplasmata archaeon]
HLLLIICVIESKRMGFYSFKRKAGELEFSPGSENPFCSVFPASPSHDRLIGSVNPGHDGGLAGRHFLSSSIQSLKEVLSVKAVCWY